MVMTIKYMSAQNYEVRLLELCYMHMQTMSMKRDIPIIQTNCGTVPVSRKSDISLAHRFSVLIDHNTDHKTMC